MKIQKFISFNENNSDVMLILVDVLETEGFSVTKHELVHNDTFKIKIDLDKDTKSTDLISNLIDYFYYPVGSTLYYKSYSSEESFNYYKILNENNHTLKRIKKLCDLVLVETNIAQNFGGVDVIGEFIYIELYFQSYENSLYIHPFIKQYK